MGQGPGLAVRDDLLDHGVVAVFPSGPQPRGRPVGEEGVVAPDGKQFALLAHDRRLGQVTDPAHDQAGGDPLALLPVGERGVPRQFGDLGVRDEFTGLGIGHRGRIGDLLPDIVGNAVDGPIDGGVHAGGDREVGAGPAAGGDHTGVVELRVGPQRGELSTDSGSVDQG